MPIAFLALLIVDRKIWSRWIDPSHRSEQIVGEVWMVTAAFSVVCVIVLVRSAKRWDAWLALTAHLLLIAFTIFPGCIAIPFLMHWLRGPGA